MAPNKPRVRPRKLKRVGPGVQQTLYPIDGHGLFKVTLTYHRGQPILTIEPGNDGANAADLAQLRPD